MPSDSPAEPWLSFFTDLDRELDGDTEFHCIGGFAVVEVYGLQRATSDVDILAIIPHHSIQRIIALAGKDSPLRVKHRIYLDVVTVASVPEDYPSRLVPLYAGYWPKLRLSALEAHDLALTKLERNFERDRGDVEYLARSGFLDAATLRRRYHDEMRPHLTGRESWHDQTLEMWIAAYLDPHGR